MNRPNIILIMTDQQRYDTVAATGAEHMITPNIDMLASEGVSFDNCFCTAPSCVPSRASFFNGQYPHALSVYNNGCPWDASWVEQLQGAGYHTANVGKMHTVPFDAACGFDQRFVVENKDRPLHHERPRGGFYDEWDKFLNNSGVRKPSRVTYRDEHPEYETALGAYEWPLDEQYHPDTFVGNMAEWFIRERNSESPMFLQIGFPGPHPPYDPPARFLDMYDGVDVPVPDVTDAELSGQTPAQKTYREEMIDGNHDAVRWQADPTVEQLARLRGHYAANVTLIDEQIGRIMAALDDRGYLDDAIVVFTSDHGDCLGDHGHVQKWTMYDEITRVPAIVCAPGRLPEGQRVDGLVQQMDLAPMLFELAGVEFPGGRSAVSALPMVTDGAPGRDAVFAEHSADNVLKGVNFISMVRTADWKLVHYLDQDCGELYDLRTDPRETNNLWGCAHHASTQAELMETLRDWRIRDGV